MRVISHFKPDFRMGLSSKQMQISLAANGHVTSGGRRHWMIVALAELTHARCDL